MDDGFLKSIYARPSDDGPRLIYADFLDESADRADRARAELIRVQCTLARISADSPARAGMLQRESELLAEFRPRWTEPLAEIAVGVEFRRGMPEAITVESATFLRQSRETFEQLGIRRVRFVNAYGETSRIAECTHLQGLRELDFTGNDLGNGGVNALVRSRFLTRIVELDLSFNGLGDSGVLLLAKARTLPRLRNLLLTDNGQIGSEGLRFLAESPHFAGLRLLDVSGNSIGDAGIHALIGSNHVSKLHTLRLYANCIGDGGAGALACSLLLHQLLRRHHEIDWRQNALGVEAVEALALSPHVETVRHLDLSGNSLGDTGAEVLAHCSNLPKLRSLSLRQCGIGNRGARALADSPLMNQLARLDMADNRITKKGIDALWNHRRNFHTIVETAGNYPHDYDIDEADVQNTPRRNWSDFRSSR